MIKNHREGKRVRHARVPHGKVATHGKNCDQKGRAIQGTRDGALEDRKKTNRPPFRHCPCGRGSRRTWPR
jgi:hypothetical protein